MSKVLIQIRGLPASGKTTKRKKLLADPSLQPIVAVNKDEIREAMGIEPGNFEREKEVLAEETRRIMEALNQGVNLIVDNVHNSEKYVTRYKQLAAQYDYKYELIDLYVPVEECIRRDALRTGREHVGEAVILRMYNQFYNKGEKKRASKPAVEKQERPEPKPRPPMEQNPNLPKALIVDLDGTLALAKDRGWYEYQKCEADEVVEPIRLIAHGLLKAGVVEHVLFLTGRENSGYDAAKRWLKDKAHFDFRKTSISIDDHTGEPIESPMFHLLMKQIGDHRPDVETKRELFDNHVRDKYYVVAVFEDRPRVIRMWNDLGLFVLAVGESLSKLMDD